MVMVIGVCKIICGGVSTAVKMNEMNVLELATLRIFSEFLSSSTSSFPGL